MAEIVTFTVLLAQNVIVVDIVKAISCFNCIYHIIIIIIMIVLVLVLATVIISQATFTLMQFFYCISVRASGLTSCSIQTINSDFNQKDCANFYCR